ncbi:UDP-2,3-diacylglucosamine diphosphatase [Chromobacterium subtsugae]|uniref:UDP-2,3-diacylglucosamine hydrolase n=1 Tax=Chromobacterium subtsugae TaxID=251747 RepID=A0ABS7FHG0_9NEIS|nr:MULTISPECIES: UDP-2,3-diacylglucosamine diphosphatase [Chromobacterium]KUM01635.1 UDP-2,3-diacylglucosamine hydrolase [Chromobacterium subtsugae]KZE87272.1 UDP-2,3-diacylglucosamine hydrolase [Chromobacterium sp. F49]MBW7568315.1 UDP-2,3-diacylglucosamine diphosphatase [Chromobacterium subtsugae]MBW8289421.1 UDP-2,3-diacylglucosamine diphosphatase [Chromobacterium subtsugae]WSE93265.1 UDP-2,3-diacylglucosamine diphosphatase [Chromobacterium subtsugae]
MAIHFISDLHLADDTPALNQLFLDTLLQWRGRIDALYILGDLFEYWVGDDDDSSYLEAPLAAMREFAASTPLYVMRGNRDFLLGAGFEARSGAKLLDDPTLTDVHGQRILLCHGDALCTDDAAYQQFRALSRSPQWQQAMLAKPLAERHAIARHARAQSEMNKQQTGLAAISDVTEAAVQALLAAHGWPTLIHGHTHRPARHRHQAGESGASRWVIQDWHGGRGGYLLLDDAGIRALPLGR